MRVFAILVVILAIAVGLFFLLTGKDAPEEIAQKPSSSGTNSSTPTTSAGKVTQKTDPTPKMEAPKAEAKPEVVEKAEKAAPTDGAKPVIVEKAQPKDQPQTSAPAIAAMAIPSFDVVRVDRNCGILAAGRAEPTSKVSIFANDVLLGTVVTTGRGEWVYVSDKPLPKGAQKINAKALNPNNQTVETARLVIMQVPDCAEKIEERAPAIAMLTPKVEDDKKSEISERVSKLLQLPEPKGNVEAAMDLSVGSVDYDEGGNVALTGRGTPGNQVFVYLKNKHIGSAIVDENGDWKLVPNTDVAPGTYTLRADQIDDGGKVISRVEIPFKREAAEDVIVAKGGLEIRAVVQPGNSLWRIARRIYGEGTQYTLIYQANEDQIKDPDLIYPGQIFKLPEK